VYQELPHYLASAFLSASAVFDRASCTAEAQRDAANLREAQTPPRIPQDSFNLQAVDNHFPGLDSTHHLSKVRILYF